jgi:hypothetical protein
VVEPAHRGRAVGTTTLGDPVQETVHAPDFPEGLEWLNVAKPLALEDLAGKLLLLEFWTFC